MKKPRYEVILKPKDLRRDTFRSGGPGGQNDEEWRPVVGYEGHYEVSSLGNVATLKWKERRLLKLQTDDYGYKHVVLSMGGKVRTTKVASIVAEAFNGPKPEGLVVRHYDDDKTNNTPGNLIYGTQQENIDDRGRNGHTVPPTGERNGMAKLNEVKVRQIDVLLIMGDHPTEIAKMFHVAPRTIRDIANGKSWTHITGRLSS